MTSTFITIIIIHHHHNHHPTLLHHHTLILDRTLTFLVAFSILVLKLSFSQSVSLHSRLSLPQGDLEL